MRGLRREGAAARLAAVFTAIVILLGTGAREAFGVVGGKTVSIASAPWNVVVWKQYATNARYAACTGVIIAPQYVLTAGHCVMVSDSSVTPQAASVFSIEAGVSNFKHPLKSDHAQWRSVSAVSAMPGYIAGNNRWYYNVDAAVGNDLAVLRLSQPLSLNGTDARAARLPSASTPKPWHAALVMAGFGDEKPAHVYDATGELREIVKPVAQRAWSSSRILAVNSTTGTCWGDSGAGIVEPGVRVTVLGVLSANEPPCGPGLNFYTPLARPAALRFIHASM